MKVSSSSVHTEPECTLLAENMRALHYLKNFFKHREQHKGDAQHDSNPQAPHHIHVSAPAPALVPAHTPSASVHPLEHVDAPLSKSHIATPRDPNVQGIAVFPDAAGNDDGMFFKVAASRLRRQSVVISRIP